MAVDSKLGETKLGVGVNGTNGAAAAAATAAAQGTKRTQRTSSLMRSSASLPKVEHSLDEFIARANQTLVDVSSWGTADKDAKEADESRRQQDALRWKTAETQMRESEAREQSLRGQLDGLQGKLAEAAARVAVALSASGSMPAMNTASIVQERAIEELRAQIAQAQTKIQTSEQKSQDLSRALELAKTEVSTRALPVDGVDHDHAEERIRHAEAKAAKAIAAARAAAAGLTVSSADLAAIESGLVVPMAPERRTPWIPIMLAFAGGLGIMFLVWKFALSNGGAAATKADPTPAPAPAPAAAAVQPEPKATPPAPPSVPGPAKPVVTPIDENPTPQPAAAKQEDSKPTVTPIEEPKVKEEPAKKDPPRAIVRKAPAPAAVRKDPPKKPAAKPAGKPAIEDPFADPAPKKPAPKKPEKPAGAIVDPFAS
ncbi:MAG: hypothetical protein ABI867_38165 [Kofleriaceae bacterium]